METEVIDTEVKVINISDFPVAVKINCKFKINGIDASLPPAYNGEHFWNLQLKEMKIGHFNLLQLFRSNQLISEDKYNDLQDAGFSYIIEELEIVVNQSKLDISMDIDIFCENEFDHSYYPPIHYSLDLERIKWIPIITSEKSYWEYNVIPEWIGNPAKK